MKKRSSHSYAMPIYLALTFILGIAFAIYLLPSKQTNFTNKQMAKFNEVLEYINKYYVDSVDVNKIFEEAISGMLQSLDPHSTYANSEENKAMMEVLDGSFEGVGIQFNIQDDTVMVVNTVSGGPSEKVGIRAGDRIVSVDGKVIAGVHIETKDVMKLLRGKKNSKVKVGIKRNGFSQIYYYDIVRDVIPTYTVDVSYMIDKQTGYIKINQFGSTTADEFNAAILKLKKEGMQKMILDLRGNSGGYLDAGIKVCDELLPKGEMIVYTEGLKVPTEKIYATGHGNFETGELVVLIDDFSASASEIVAGAIQDNDRGIIIGRRSFGKGLVQRQLNLSDNSSIRLTVSRYHTPSGRYIQRDYKDGNDAYYEELVKRYQNGEMSSKDSIKEDKSLQYKTRKGRIVYGGGGIMPDYFVPLDRDSNMTAFYQVLNSGSIIQFAFEYTNQNRKRLIETYPDAAAFVKNMQVSDALLEQLLQQYSKKFGTPARVNDASRKELKVWLKAFIGRNLHQDNAFYPVINTTDKVIMEALSVLRTNKDI